MKKLFLLVLSLNIISLWGAGELALQQGVDAVDFEWDDLVVDLDKGHLVYQNARKHDYLIRIQEPGKKPYDLTLGPDSTTVLSFNRAGGVVKTWNFRNGEWRKSFDFSLSWPDVQWRKSLGKPLSPKLQRERELLSEKLVKPVQARKDQLIDAEIALEEEYKGWLAGIIESLFGSSQDGDS